MFEHCYIFNENISGWDVSSVKNMERMFDECNFFCTRYF
ncbi:BspA family leucine-rich repeat surface protein [Campylobacter devanensis]